MILVWVAIIGGTVSALGWVMTAVEAKAGAAAVLKGLLYIVVGMLVVICLLLAIRSLLRSLRIIASTHQTDVSASPEELCDLRGEPPPLPKTNRLSMVGQIRLNDPNEKEK